MKNRTLKQILPRAALALLLCFSVTIAGCSTSWITTLDNILVAAAPALINILNIIAIAKGVPVNAALSTKITIDAATIKALASNFAAASTTAAPTACAQLQAAINTYSSDQASVLSLAQVTDPNTQTKIMTLSALVAGTVSAVLAVIPSCSAVASLRASLATQTVPLPLRSFVKNYNSTLTVPTGLAGVDSYTKSHKVHVHSKLARVLSLNFSY